MMRLTGNLTRRSAIRVGAAIASAQMFHTSAAAQSRPNAPSQRLETAVIGIGERGKYLIANLPPAFRVTALCDCWMDQIDSVRKPPQRFAGLLDRFIDRDLPSCRIFQDYRQMLDEQRFDAVIIAAPDHHHALASILAMQAGAHVYVEKPLAVTIGEGRAIVDAATKYDRVVQVGSQQRTMQINRTACEFLRAGGLGKIHLVEERNFPGPMPYDEIDLVEQDVPASLDWDLFCGPTPLRSYNRKLWSKDAFKVGYLTWRGWDLFRDYSGHLMTNWGAHSVDMIQYALGTDATGPVEIDVMPKQVNASTDDQWRQKTPPLGTLRSVRVDRARFSPVVMRYADGTEVHFKPDVKKTVVYGEKGKLFLGRNAYRTEPRELLPPPDAEQQAAWSGKGFVARPHLQNWLDAIQSDGVVNAPPEIGHRSATVCHLANLARQLGRKVRWDPDKEAFIGDPDVDEQLHRVRRRGFELPAV